MVRKAESRKYETAENKFGAQGSLEMHHIVDGVDELNGKGRVFAHTVVHPHSGIGFHVHKGDSEIYYVVSGRARYNDNGTWVDIGVGDTTICRPGTGHAVENDHDEPFEMIALILYE